MAILKGYGEYPAKYRLLLLIATLIVCGKNHRKLYSSSDVLQLCDLSVSGGM